MYRRTLLLLVALGSNAACWAQGRIGRAGPVTALDGSVFAFETGEPIPHAEVCVFGSDTTCVRADGRGRYRIRVQPGTVTVRFRSPGMPFAVVRGVQLSMGSTVRVNCTVSGRISLAEETACLGR